MGWQRCVLDMTVVTLEVVRVNDTEGVAASLTLAIHSFSLVVLVDFHLIQFTVQGLDFHHLILFLVLLAANHLLMF